MYDQRLFNMMDCRAKQFMEPQTRLKIPHLHPFALNPHQTNRLAV